MNLIKKYRYALIILVYALIYMSIFQYLETRTNITHHIIHCSIDKLIPFCEYFIVPYFLWFPYMITMVLYFVLLNRNSLECRRLLITLCSGMTIFLIVSYVYPNGLQLRPTTLSNDNIFIRLVASLYSMDTATNVLPSIHVYNTIAIYMAISNCDKLKSHVFVRIFTFLLTILILLSTMFLKQHSFIDVVVAILLVFAIYLPVYHREWLKNSAVIKQQV